MPSKYLSVPEAAEVIGISTKAAWQRLYRGELPYRRWGRRVMIPVDELESFLRSLPGKTADEAVAAVEEGRGWR
jgi:excisionase family DNA binding protein